MADAESRTTTTTRNRPPTARGGISLLEVLISIFVLAVGLLGLAVLIPAGQVTLQEAGIADRSAVCGRSGLQEVKIRRMLEAFRRPLDNPSATEPVQMWLRISDHGGSDGVPGDTSLETDYRFDLTSDDWETLGPVCIDPYGIALAAARHDVLGENVHYDVDLMMDFPAVDSNNYPADSLATMPRVTLAATPQTDSANTLFAGPALNLAQAERIFMRRDDLVFPRPKDQTRRPLAQLDDSGVVQHTGDYSWMVTLVPNLTDVVLQPKQRSLFSVSIVVFFNRDPVVADAPEYEYLAAEEVLFVERFLGGTGQGGGSVVLTGVADVKEDEWVLLCGKVNDERFQPPEERKIFQWYRVASAGLLEQTGTTALTLAGPDWDVVDNEKPQLVVVKGVVGVYTKTVELNLNTVWTE